MNLIFIQLLEGNENKYDNLKYRIIITISSSLF